MKKILIIIAIMSQLILLQAQKSIDVTYIADAGFLFKSDTSKLLIDGIFNQGYGYYYTPTAQTLTNERNATFPFNDINAILITHAHDDHINPDYLTEHMLHDSNAILLAPYLAVNRLEPVTGYDAIKSRIREITQANQSKLDTTIEGIQIKSMAIRHNDSTFLPTLNLGLVFEINGIKIFHPGDADTANLNIYQGLALADDSIDIALIPYWFFLTNTGINIVNYLNPKAIIVTHVMLPQQTYNYAYVKNLIKNLTNIPPIYFMETPMENLNFNKENDSIFTFSDSDSAYFGQTPPGNTPVLFAPGIVSLTNRSEKVITFSPDGTEVFFVKNQWPNCRIMYSHYTDSGWATPDLAPFQDNVLCDEPFFSLDGSRVYYYRMVGGNAIIGYSEKLGSIWQPFVSLGSTLNSTTEQYHPCIVSDGSIYFADAGGSLCRSQYTNGSYGSRVGLPYPVNGTETDNNWVDPYVSPDENYMIIHSTRSGGYGAADLYISYKKSNGTWTNPKNLGDKINTSAREVDGDITPDGKYMVYSQNMDDIYWVSASFIDSLRNTNFIPYYMPGSISNQTDTIDHPFSYTIPSQAFIDDDGNNTLTFAATLNDGSTLPGWLSFDTTTLTFSGSPADVEDLSIKVIATDTAGASCSATFALSIVEGFTSISSTDAQELEIYPNPSNGIVTISFGTKPVNEATINIYNLLGEQVYSEKIRNSSQSVLDLSNTPNGTYLAKINFDNTVLTKTILLQ